MPTLQPAQASQQHSIKSTSTAKLGRRIVWEGGLKIIANEYAFQSGSCGRTTAAITGCTRPAGEGRSDS